MLPVKLPRDSWVIGVCPECGAAQAHPMAPGQAGLCAGSEDHPHSFVQSVPVTVVSAEVQA